MLLLIFLLIGSLKCLDVLEVSHVGFVVSDMEKYLDLYLNVFHFSKLFDRYVHNNTDVATELGFPLDDPPTLRNVMLLSPNGSFKVQLFQYFHPSDGKIVKHRIYDQGFYNHLGIGVKDIKQAWEDLHNVEGLTFLADHYIETSGFAIFYALDFDGNYLEIYQKL